MVAINDDRSTVWTHNEMIYVISPLKPESEAESMLSCSMSLTGVYLIVSL